MKTTLRTTRHDCSSLSHMQCDPNRLSSTFAVDFHSICLLSTNDWNRIIDVQACAMNVTASQRIYYLNSTTINYVRMVYTARHSSSSPRIGQAAPPATGLVSFVGSPLFDDLLSPPSLSCHAAEGACKLSPANVSAIGPTNPSQGRGDIVRRPLARWPQSGSISRAHRHPSRTPETSQ